MSDKLQQFRAILEDMFQLNQADLDFGIYRIMNQKRQEIIRFLDVDLLPQVEAAFVQVGGENKALLEKELADVTKSLVDAGATPEVINDLPKVRDLRSRLTTSEHGSQALADDVFSHLTNFFHRYYKEGDFISLPRYKDGVYAIPYNGEEVKLHWANADQYYIKTTEYFRDYVFRLENGRVVHFKLVEASTEQDNNKAEKDKERRFMLAPENTVGMENDELVIRFAYQVMKEKQNKLNQTAIKILQEILGSAEFAGFAGVRQLMPTEKDPKRTLLEKHLNDYTSKNSFDYFIHKDLGGFLRRELDFYIKNEVMFLDDLDTENEVNAHHYLNKIKVIKRIGNKIIAFLAQLEDFQKKLWLKKKFVVETNYCLTLDRVPEQFYPEIIANQAQIDEWKRLFAIDEVENYAEPIKEEFLRANPYLVLDTAFYNPEFKERLVASMEDIDGNMGGLLVNADNFHAVKLISDRFNNEIGVIYLDPPYNTNEEAFKYKNSYKHSSWAAMMYDRINLGKYLLTDGGVSCIAIDDTETAILRGILDDLYGVDNRVASLAIQVNPAGQNLKPNAPALSHDYCHIYVKNINQMRLLLRPLTEQEKEQYSENDGDGFYLWDNLRRRGGNSRPIDRPNQWYPLYVKLENNTISLKPFAESLEIWPVDPKGIERIWRVDPVGAQRDISNNELSLTIKNGRIEVIKKTWMPSGKKPKTLWSDSKYSATTHGTKLLIDYFKENKFSYPKSIYLVQDILQYWTESDGIVLDYFAGSGTTAHAVINLNREDHGSRKYILVEMGEYFDSVTKPRVQKVIYSKDWKDGKPVSREGSSHMFKYIRLESYEDTLNNLALKRTEAQQMQLDLHDKIREEYLLSYMLEFETQDSTSLLNLEQFSNPFDYKLNIARRNESCPVVVDLPETFNCLLGLTVRQTEMVRGFKIVRGELPSGQRALIIWRNLHEKSNQDLEEFLDRSGYNPRDNEFDRIYVNGDNHIENRRTEGERWKVLLIEEEFKRLMFDVRDL